MFTTKKYLVHTILVCLAISVTAAVGMADVPEQVVKDRKSYLPYRKYQKLPGKTIGVLVGETRPVLTIEGRGSAANVLCFSQDGGSYRWVYVPDRIGRGQITNLRVPLANGKKHLYGALNMADPESVALFGVRTLFTLVEVEVNEGHGSPVNDSFVATRFKVLEGSAQYPLRVAEVLTRLRKDYDTWLTAHQKQIDAEMMQARKKALANRKPNAQRQMQDLMYITWMTADATLHVRFRTKLSNGHYTYVQGGAPIRPFPLPPNPKKFPPPPAAVPGGGAVPVAPGRPGGAVPVAPGRPGGIAPPPRFRVKVGTTYGVELGRTYVVSKAGKILRTERLDFASFQQNLNPPPGIRRPFDPVRPLPGVPGKRSR